MKATSHQVMQRRKATLGRLRFILINARTLFGVTPRETADRSENLAAGALRIRTFEVIRPRLRRARQAMGLNCNQIEKEEVAQRIDSASANRGKQD